MADAAEGRSMAVLARSKSGRQLAAHTQRRSYACRHDAESQQAVGREKSRESFECARAPVLLKYGLTGEWAVG